MAHQPSRIGKGARMSNDARSQILPRTANGRAVHIHRAAWTARMDRTRAWRTGTLCLRFTARTRHPCAQFKFYLMIEGGIWLPACYLFCYRFQPTVRVLASPTGRAAVARTGAALERWAPSWRASIVKLASKIDGAPATRAFGEWALINKLLAPIGFPIKMGIAHKIVEGRKEAGIAKFL